MQVTETLNEGLKRKLSVIIPAADLNTRLDAKLEEIKGQANIKGFRPGKVPLSHIRKMFGRSAMSDVMTDSINSTVASTLDERNERAAVQPKVDLPDDQAVIKEVLDGKADLTFEVEYEVLPPVKLMPLDGIKLNKPLVDIAEEEVTTEVNRLFTQQRGYADKGDGAIAETGDRLGLSFVGRIDGEEFEGGRSDNAHLTIGAGEFIPGFEEQLVGMKKGESREIEVTFPADYQTARLAGKQARFDVTILEVNGPNPGVLDDDFAKRLGLENVEALREAVKGQMQATLASMSRQHMKRQILDALDEGHKFDVPVQLVDAEFAAIWQRVEHEVKAHGRSFEDEGTTEEAAREQYHRIAERRVRLGLVVAEIGNVNNVEVTEEEHQRALVAEVRRFPGQEQQVYDYYRKNPQALAGLRAPVFENKVVDFLVEKGDVTEQAMTREELTRLIQADEDEVPEEHHH